MRHKASYTFAMLLLIGMLFLAGGSADAAYETGGVVKAILSNGVTVLVLPEPEARVAAIEVFVRVGALDEDAYNYGIGQLLAGSVFAGTRSRSAANLAKLLSGVGGSFLASWQWNYLEVYAVTPPETCEEAIGLLSDAIQNARMDSAAVEYSRTMLLREVRRQEEDAFNSAYAVLRRLVHRGTPYDRPYLGDPEQIKAIGDKQLREFYERTFSADRIVISVAGAVDTQRIIRKIEICFGHMTRRNSSPEMNGLLARGGKNEATILKPTPVTYTLLGYPAPGVGDPDYPAMCVANVLLGGNKSSLLFSRLREGRGLGYQVGSLYPALRSGSHIAAYLGMDTARATPETLKTVREAMLEQIDALRSGGFTDEDLEHAKRYLIGNHALRHERTRDRAFYLGWYEVIGLGYQYDFQHAEKVRKVTREDVRRVCARFLDRPSVVVLTGPPSADGNLPNKDAQNTQDR